MTEPSTKTLPVGHRAITARTWGVGTPAIVMLHDGLGSTEQWRQVPEMLARRTGLTVLAYDRAGHGSSTPVPQGAWPADWMHQEAEVLAELLQVIDCPRPLLVGHSDGGSIAAIHAASGAEVAGTVLIAAHSWVEQAAIDEISRLRADPTDIIGALGRFHVEPGALFEAWSGVWTSDTFASWDIRPLLAGVAAPALVVQGDGDEYGTPQQAIETADAIGANATCLLLAGLGHLVHHQAPDLLCDLVVDFIRDTPLHSTIS